MGSLLPSLVPAKRAAAFTASFWWYYGYTVEGAV
jgi:hypothetical protein